jgi:hypothetical protein
MPTLQQPPVTGAVLSAPDLDNPSAYRMHVGVPILPAKEQPVVDPKTGKAIINPKTGKPATVRWTESELYRIAADCNERTRQHKWIPPQIGHSDLSTADERSQPKHLGLYRNWRVGPLLDKHGVPVDPTPHLIADEVIRAEDDEEASTYPHRSPQMNVDFRDPGCTTIDSVALLRRPPRHEMGHTVGLGVIFNARDAATGYVPDEAETLNRPEEATPEGGAADPFPLEPPTGETQAPDPGEDTMPEMTPPADTIGSMTKQELVELIGSVLDSYAAPQGDESEPIQNEGAAPSGMDTFTPGADSIGEEEDPAIQNCGDENYQMHNARIGDLESKLDKVIAENNDLHDTVGRLTMHNERQAWGVKLTELIDQGVKMDPLEDEITRILRFVPEDRPAELKRIEIHNARTSAGAARIPVLNGKPATAPPIDQATRDRIVAHAHRNNLSYDAAKAAVLSGSV